MSRIKVYNQALSTEFCQSMIDMFEDKACCKVRHGNDLSYKIDTGDSSEWIKMVNKLKESRDHFVNSYFIEFPDLAGEIKCGGYEITRYSPVSNSTEFYGIAGKLSAVWFLNNIGIGGSVMLVEDGKTVEIKPETSKLIIFPNNTVQLQRQLIGNASKYLVINNISEIETPV